MTDQVASLNREPPLGQIGAPNSFCGGSSACTDTAIQMIVRHATGKTVTAHDVRQAAAPAKDPCRGLNPTEAVRALAHFGLRDYRVLINATAADAIRATDAGVVLWGEGYGGHPLVREAEVGGRTDLGFTGPHADTLWGRRNWTKAPPSWPAGKPFAKGWRVWGRDPDHHASSPPPYDRFSSRYLVRAMDALIGCQGWQVRFIISRPISRLQLAKSVQRTLDALDDEHAAPLLPSLDVDQLPDMGTGQAG